MNSTGVEGRVKLSGASILERLRARMRRRILFSSIAIFIFGVAILSSSAQTVAANSVSRNSAVGDIIINEKLFQKFKMSGDVVELNKLMLPDFREVEDKVLNRDQELASAKGYSELGCKGGRFEIINPKIVFLSADIVSIVYHATKTAICGSRTFSAGSNISTIWVNRNGSWQMHIHAEYADIPK
ncbi:MAG: nuclear transport factor 2 family protein [Terracidiphilus sp.]